MYNNEVFIQSFIDNYPFFTREDVDDNTTFSGLYHFNMCYKDICFDDYFELIIIINRNKKNNPIVYERRRIEKFHHKFTDGSLCLGIPMEITLYLKRNNFDLVLFFKNYIDTYLYGFLYYEQYSIMPFGERSHGYQGYIEYFRDIFGLSNENGLTNFLNYLSNNLEYKGHHNCPCGSGLKVRNCHKDVLFHYFNVKNEIVIAEIRKYLEGIKHVKIKNTR